MPGLNGHALDAILEQRCLAQPDPLKEVVEPKVLQDVLTSDKKQAVEVCKNS